MTITLYVFGLLLLFVASHWLTGRVRTFALQNQIVDHPNHRSAHRRPTPRGGGLAFSLLIGVALAACLAIYPDASEVWIAMLGGGVLVAGVGWLDDKKDLSPRLRIAVHLIAAAWATYWLGGCQQIRLGGASIYLGDLGALIAVIAISWSINLFNFMDGIDGIAAAEAVFIAAVASMLTAWAGDLALAAALGVFASTAAGFLIWNLPPAKIFMGDCGSGLLGFLFAASALATESRGSLSLPVWVLLGSVFLVDATATLVRRLLLGERWYEAHCDHAYQRAVRTGRSHAQVTTTTMVLNLLLALPVLIAFLWPENALLVVGVAATALLLLWLGVIGATSALNAPDSRPASSEAFPVESLNVLPATAPTTHRRKAA